MKYWIIILALLVIPLTSAVEPEFIFQKNTNPELTFTCIDEFTGLPCNNLYSCNITAYYPNNTLLLNDTALSREGSNYEIALSGLSVNGFYQYNGFCTNGTDSGTSEDLFFRVTETGQVFSEGQGLASFALMAGVLALAFIFMILGFRFTERPATMPLSLFFIVLGLILGIYSLYLGLEYSVILLEYTGLINVQTTIFQVILQLVVWFGIISFILMTVGFLREFGKGRMMKNYGEGFDPISQTYQ